MEKIPGIRWSEKNNLNLQEKGYTQQDINNLTDEIEQKILELKEIFEQAGVSRSWKVKDMVFDIDIEHKKIKTITPTDWERTKIQEK